MHVNNAVIVLSKCLIMILGERSKEIERDERGFQHVDREEASAVPASHCNHHCQTPIRHTYLINLKKKKERN